MSTVSSPTLPLFTASLSGWKTSSLGLAATTVMLNSTITLPGLLRRKTKFLQLILPFPQITMKTETQGVRLQISLLILTLSWRGPLSYRNQSIDLQSTSMDRFLYNNGLRHERVKPLRSDGEVHRMVSLPKPIR